MHRVTEAHLPMSLSSPFFRAKAFSQVKVFPSIVHDSIVVRRKWKCFEKNTAEGTFKTFKLEIKELLVFQPCAL